MWHTFCVDHLGGGGGSPGTELTPKADFGSFPSLNSREGANRLFENKITIEVIHRERVWVINVSNPLDIAGEEVWSRSIVCCQSTANIYWEEIAIYICEDLNLVEEVEWITIGELCAILICSSDKEAERLCAMKVVFPGKGEIECSVWNLEILTFCYEKLVIEWCIRLWGLSLNLWTMGIFKAVGKLCGGLNIVDECTLNCE